MKKVLFLSIVILLSLTKIGSAQNTLYGRVLNMNEDMTLSKYDTLKIVLVPETSFADAQNRLSQQLMETYLSHCDTIFTMPMINPDVPVASYSSDDFDFLFKGMDFIEACAFFGDFYMDLEKKDLALNYYNLALQMCETLNGYEGADFNDQIKQLNSIIAKINK